MAYVDDPWPEGFAHRYITKAALMALLQTIPDGSLLVVNQVGNLAVMDGLNPYARLVPEDDRIYNHQLGWIDLGAETFERL